MSAARSRLPGGRLHFQHGPIDIVIGADGDARAVAAAHEDAWRRFATVLDELVAELPALRRPVGETCPLEGVVARRMWEACRPFRDRFVTPMAAVAGSVAQELVASYARDGVTRAWVNNGGDIALHLASGHAVRIGLFADIGRLAPAVASGDPGIDAEFVVDEAMPVRGVATSGWRGRSLSLGIADSVTVLARTAAEADAAATMIANAVDVDEPRIVRRPAREVRDDSDLRDLPVTVDVPSLDAVQVHEALRSGCARARAIVEAGRAWSATLVCQGWVADVRDPAPRRLPGPAARRDACEASHGAAAA
ncbi:hypothetical protein BURK1_02791 [Burkholderiales bacterium]|nr:hypothetical protein BURK1_02791 [Burkholderiales bacterium]